MKKNVFLGVGRGDRCCVLRTFADYNTLSANINSIETDDFVHSSTDWSGCDYLERTLKIEKLKLTGREIMLKTPLIFCGTDNDMGHACDWEFLVRCLVEVVEDD